MSWGVLNAAMLVGLLGVALPVIIHLLNRRRETVIDWGAMQFLEPGRRARQENPPGRDLADGRPDGACWLSSRWRWRARSGHGKPRSSGRAGPSGSGLDGPPRDVVLILDVSESMERKLGDSSALDRAAAWARTFAGRCRPGDSIALLLAGDGVRRLIDPPTFDLAKVRHAPGRRQAAAGGERPAGGPGRGASAFSSEPKTPDAM